MNGPTHANEARQNVSPMSSVPAEPPRFDSAFSFVNRLLGSVISKAPNRLNPNTRKTKAIRLLTHGLEPSFTTANGPSAAVNPKPIAVNKSMIPRQNTSACRTACPRVGFPWFRKNDMVIGIIGNTQGVKMEASPKPKASSRNAPSP